MAQLTIGDKTVTVGDEFLKLSPDAQAATVEEIAAALKVAPPAAPVPAAPMQPLDDVGRSLDKGLAKGVAGWIGGPAAMANLAASGADYVTSKVTGKPYEQVKAENDARAVLPTTTVDRFGPAAVERAMRENLPGAPAMLDYQPQTVAGQYAQTAGEFIPSGITNPIASLVSAAGSETAGQLTKGTAAEPYARTAGAILTPAVGARAITPVRTPAARAPFVERMEAEGVGLTAGERTGSRVLREMENTLGDALASGGAATAQAERSGQQFNRAVARRMGEDADMLTTDVMHRASSRLGREFQRLSAGNTLQQDQQLVADIVRTAQEYLPTLPATQQATLQNWLTHIGAQFDPSGAMRGTSYQRLRSRLSRNADGLAQNDPEMGRALDGLRNALDDAMERSIRPEDATAWQTARQQWAAMKDIQRAMAGSGTRTAQGYASPAQLRSVAANRNQAAYTRGQSDLGELARAAEATRKPLPDSGTAGRSRALEVATTIPAGIAGMAVGGSGAGLAAALAAALGPGLAGRALMSRPVQGYLGNAAIQRGPPSRVAELLRAAQRVQLAGP